MLYYCVLLDLCDFKDPRAIISEFSRQKYSVSEGIPELVENPNTSRTPWRVQYAIRRENEGLRARTSVHMSSQIAHLASQNTEVTSYNATLSTQMTVPSTQMSAILARLNAPTRSGGACYGCRPMYSLTLKCRCGYTK